MPEPKKIRIQTFTVDTPATEDAEETPPTPLTCYADSVDPYRASDLGYPLPIPRGQKANPPPSMTGAYRTEGPTTQEYIKFIGDSPDWNVGLRLAPNVIGIDIDTYDKINFKGEIVHKDGITAIRDLEQELGPLPGTYISSSRENPLESGIRYFSVPEGTKLQSDIGPDVEIIQNTHRYAMVKPSVVADRQYEVELPGSNSAATEPVVIDRWYKWYDAQGQEVDEIPNFDDLPKLPGAWKKYLTQQRSASPNSNTKSKLSVFVPTVTLTETQALESLEKSKDAFFKLSEGAGFNGALYGFSKDCMRYWLSKGLDETDAYDKLCATVQEHPEYVSWGRLNWQDVATLRSAKDRILSDSHELINIVPDPEAYHPKKKKGAGDPLKKRVNKHLWKDKMINRSTGLLFGEGGVGKSSLYIKIAAKLSLGTLPGHFYGQEGVTLVYTKEDDLESVFNPRLEASGADADYIEWPMRGDITFPSGADQLSVELDRLDPWCRLVVFDPLDQYLDSDLDGNKSKDVAKAFHVLNQIASEKNVTILGIKHRNKATGSSSYHRVSGSTAYVDHSRFVLEADRTEDYEDTGEFSVGLIKSNSMPTNVPALRYTIETATFTDNVSDLAGQTDTTSYVKFVGDSQHNQQEESARRTRKVKQVVDGKKEEEVNTAKGNARLWLVQALSKHGGMLTSGQLRDMIEKSNNDITWASLQRAMHDYKAEEKERHPTTGSYCLDSYWVKEKLGQGVFPDKTRIGGTYKYPDGCQNVRPDAEGIEKMKSYQGPYADEVAIYVETLGA